MGRREHAVGHGYECIHGIRGRCVTDVKEAVRARVIAHRDELIELSHRIHSHPELAFEERRAAAWVADAMATGGFQVETGIGGLETALVARRGVGALHIAFCAEYDALPEIGHACGHNIIAAASVGAGLALAEFTGDVDLRVSVIGTPAEERGGGKIALLEAGIFDDVHAAMMVHPWPREILEPVVLALDWLDVRYRGRPAHASAYPEDGVNAADAMVLAQTALALLRQQLRRTDRVHGIVTHQGDAPNVIPALAEGRWITRAETSAELKDLSDRVRHCFEGAALATGALLEFASGGAPYGEMLHDHEISALYRGNAEALGRVFPDHADIPSRTAASTDMGNVSQVIASIQPTMSIDSLPATNHTREFAVCAVSDAADRAVIDGAVGLAWTAIDAASDQHLHKRLRANSSRNRLAAP